MPRRFSGGDDDEAAAWCGKKLLFLVLVAVSAAVLSGRDAPVYGTARLGDTARLEALERAFAEELARTPQTTQPALPQQQQQQQREPMLPQQQERQHVLLPKQQQQQQKKKKKHRQQEKEKAPVATEPLLDKKAVPSALSFHGLYDCAIGSPCPSYSASFLTSRDQLLSHPVTEARMQKRNTNMETASYHAMGGQGSSNVWRSVDALDFSVVHLSMAERMLHSRETTSPLGDAVYEIYLEKLRAYESKLRSLKIKLGPRASRTMGIMPFYAAGGAGSGHTKFEGKALYLNITILGLRANFGGLTVSCLHPEDCAFLRRGVGLPPIDDIVEVDPERLAVNKPPFLGVATIRAIQELWGEDDGFRLVEPPSPSRSSLWARYGYVFYTEADQHVIVRDRHRELLYRALDERGKKLSILTPHRLNAVPRDSDFAEITARGGLPNYDMKSDPWYNNFFGDPKRGGWVRRELEGYGAKRLVEFSTDLSDGSCCYLRRGETAYPYDARGKEGGARLDASRPGEFRESEPRPSPVDLFTIGETSLAVMAGLCCQICARRSRFGRHCDNYCEPRGADEPQDCARGAYAEETTLLL